MAPAATLLAVALHPGRRSPRPRGRRRGGPRRRWRRKGHPGASERVAIARPSDRPPTSAGIRIGRVAYGNWT